MPVYAASGASPAAARETQSIVFLSNGVIELLYSGAEISSPSCSMKSFFSFVAFSLVYGWLMIQRTRLARWEDELEAGGLDAAIVARQSEGSQQLIGATS